jgi:peptidoglycan/xylan/chitin deacetylase (PgdA/CDA1 family)
MSGCVMLRVPPPAATDLRRTAKRALFSIGYYHQRLSQRGLPGVAALCYHGVRKTSDTSIPFADLHVDVEVFEAHCRFIADACTPISLEQFRAARVGAAALPPRPVIVTFDDGYRSVLDRALPCLERYGIPAVVFVCSDPVIRSQRFWFDTLAERDGADAVTRAAAHPYGDWCALREPVAAFFDEGDAHRPMTVAELRQLASSPLIEIGAHTKSHPNLARAEVDEQQREILGGRAALESALNRSVRTFAYPVGKVDTHYTEQTVSIVRKAGFDMAFTTRPSFLTRDSDPLQLPRFLMLDAVDDVELAHRLAHSWHTDT